MMRRKAPATFFCLAVLGVLPATAHGQTSPKSIDAAREAARAAADKGQELYDAGRYEEAIVAFHDADKTFHASTILLMLARSYEKLGRLREARAQYQQVIDEVLANYAPRIFFEAQLEARKELEALVPRIPTLQVTVTGAPAADVQLTVDGAPATVGEALQLDPGEHTVSATVPGRAQATQLVNLEERAKAQIMLVLQAAAPPPPPPQAPPSRQAPVRVRPKGPESPPPSARGYVGPAIAAFGVAGLAVGVGAVTGALTLSKGSKLREECLGARCYDDSGGNTYDSAETLGALSTVSFVGGGIAAAAGVTLLLWPRSSEGAQVGVGVGPGWTGVRGAF